VVEYLNRILKIKGLNPGESCSHRERVNGERKKLMLSKLYTFNSGKLVAKRHSFRTSKMTYLLDNLLRFRNIFYLSPKLSQLSFLF
jgi:hypothetical protein